MVGEELIGAKHSFVRSDKVSQRTGVGVTSAQCLVIQLKT